MQEEPKWLEKYQRHDLKVTKGDLEGLSPYLVAQITAVNTSRSGGVPPLCFCFCSVHLL